MFAIAFDLVVADAAEHHPRGVTAAYTDIGTTLKKFKFERQGMSAGSQFAVRFTVTSFMRMSWSPGAITSGRTQTR